MRWRGLMCGAVAVVLAYASPQPARGAPPLSDAGPVLSELGRKVQDQSQPIALRLQLIKTLGDWGSAQVRPPLVAALKDPQPAIREAAALALGWPGNVEAVSPLRERVETPDEALGVKRAAVLSLGQIGDRSVRPLVIALTRDPNAPIREAAVMSLALGGLVEPADQTAYLIQLAEDRPADPQARSEAIRILAGKGKEERIVASLSRILQSEPRANIALPPRQPTDEEVMALRRAQARDVPAWAAGVLGKLEVKEALPLLLSAAEDPNDFFLRVMSVEALVAWKAPEAFPVFVRRLDDPLPEVRLLAVVGLARLGDPKGVDPMLPYLSDEQPTMRAQVVAGLAELGGPKVRAQLEALNDKELDPEVLQALETALTRLRR
jgi:HEAT repeat protein